MKPKPWSLWVAALAGVLIGIVLSLANRGLPTNPPRFIGNLLGTAGLFVIIAIARNRMTGARK